MFGIIIKNLSKPSMTSSDYYLFHCSLNSMNFMGRKKRNNKSFRPSLLFNRNSYYFSFLNICYALNLLTNMRDTQSKQYLPLIVNKYRRFNYRNPSPSFVLVVVIVVWFRMKKRKLHVLFSFHFLFPVFRLRDQILLLISDFSVRIYARLHILVKSSEKQNDKTEHSSMSNNA